MKKLRVLGATVVLATGMLWGGAPSAQASTCMIADEDLEAVVCTVYFTTMGIVCKPLEKLGGCLN